MSSSQKTVFKSKQTICVGDEVSVRENPNSSWLKGEVKSLNPMEVQVDGWPVPMSFKFVRGKKIRKMRIYHDIGSDGLGKSTRFRWIACSDLPHLLGKQGKRVKRIQEEFKNCEINIIDNETVCYDYEAEMWIEKRKKYFSTRGYTAFNPGAIDVLWFKSYQQAQSRRQMNACRKSSNFETKCVFGGI
eukprot:UN23729